MATIISCCSRSYHAREFYIEPKGHIWRSLVFLDECPNCGRAIAEIRGRRYDDKVLVDVRRTGEAAINLYEKYRNVVTPICKPKAGTRGNMNWLWFDGSKDLWVRDFNNTKIFKQNNEFMLTSLYGT